MPHDADYVYPIPIFNKCLDTPLLLALYCICLALHFYTISTMPNLSRIYLGLRCYFWHEVYQKYVPKQHSWHDEDTILYVNVNKPQSYNPAYAQVALVHPKLRHCD